MDATFEKLEKAFEASYVEDLQNWVQSAKINKPVVIVGHQVSMAAHRVSGQLAKDYRRWDYVLYSGAGDYGVENKNEFEQTDIRAVAQEIEQRIGSTGLKEAIRDKANASDLSPGNSHQLLQKIPIDAYITTSQFDTLLEDDKRTRVMEPARATVAKKKEGSVDLLYLHGHPIDEKQGVFSNTEFDRVRKSELFKHAVKLIQDNPCLIMGYEIDDPDLEQILRLFVNAQNSGKGVLNAVMFVDQNDLSSEITNRWKNVGVKIVPFREEPSDFPTWQKYINYFLQLLVVEEKEEDPSIEKFIKSQDRHKRVVVAIMLIGLLVPFIVWLLQSETKNYTPQKIVDGDIDFGIENELDLDEEPPVDLPNPEKDKEIKEKPKRYPKPEPDPYFEPLDGDEPEEPSKPGKPDPPQLGYKDLKQFNDRYDRIIKDGTTGESRKALKEFCKEIDRAQALGIRKLIQRRFSLNRLNVKNATDAAVQLRRLIQVLLADEERETANLQLIQDEIYDDYAREIDSVLLQNDVQEKLIICWIYQTAPIPQSEIDNWEKSCK